MKRKYLALAITLACTGTPAQELQKIEIKTARYDQRREDTASTLVISREELAAHGDRTLADSLRRLPGVTVSDGGGIRMRGLGNGYTQVLLNDLPAPSGFSLDSLPPEVIERIEVLRNASAALGAQGVAGTVNIVLRKSANRNAQEYAVGVDSLHGELSPRLTALSTGKAERWSHNASAVLVRTSTPAERTIIESAPGLKRSTASHEQNVGDALTITPRFNWALANGDTISSQNLVTLTRRDIRLHSQENVLHGATGDFAELRSRFRSRGLFLRSDWSWQRSLENNAQLEFKLGGNHSPRSTGFDFTGWPAVLPGPTQRRVDGVIREHGFNHGAKYSRPLGNGHALVAGWDGSVSKRMQTRLEHEWAHDGKLNFVRDDRYDGRIEQLAGFVQDEWTSNGNSWSAGLRWETMQTDAKDRLSAPVRQRSTVLSPVLNWMHKLPSGAQWRLGASRSYKAPNMLDLIPRRFTSDNNNSATNPDLQGNPALRPELAWGLDAGYDHYFGKDGMLSASVYARTIDNVIVTALTKEGNRWISMPANHGSAQAYGATLEARLPVSEQLSLRGNVALNRSRLDSVPGPDNRLARQSPLSAAATIDYKLAAVTLGAEFVYEAGGRSRNSPAYTSTAPFQRKLDLRAAWKIDRHRQVRFAISDVLQQSRTNVEHHETAEEWRQSSIRTQGGASLRLNFEAKY